MYGLLTLVKLDLAQAEPGLTSVIFSEVPES